MTRLRPVLAASTLALTALASWGAAADHLAERAAAYRVLAPVEAMPPAHRAAYVVALREELAAHGYDAGPPEAVVDPHLAAAIRAYQRDAGLPVDGVASRELLDHLMFALPKVYAARTFPGAGAAVPLPPRPPAPLAPQPDQGPAPGPGYWPDGVTEEPLPDLPQPPPEAATAAPMPEAPPAGTEAAPEAAPDPTIGGVVSQVQAELKRRGYYPGPVDGRFTPETSAAVRRFQADNGLPADGVINRALLDALEG